MQVLKRSKQSVTLTAMGEILLSEATSIVERYDSMLETLRLHRDGFEGTLGIGMLYYSKEQIILAINEFQKEFPKVQLHFLSKTPIEIVNALMNDEIDIGSLLRVEFLDSEKLKFVNVSREPMIMAVNTAHRLADRTKVSVKELENEIYIAVDDAFFRGHLVYVSNLLHKYGVKITSVSFVKDYESLLLAVQAGEGVTLLSYNLKKHINPYSVYLDLEEEMTITRCVAYKSNNTNPIIPNFLKFFPLLLLPT
jgi:DNA-binding transcriptional LysR family regulator